MRKRFACVWFYHFLPDYFIRRRPELKNKPFVLAVLVRGRKIITAVSLPARKEGIKPGMVTADAKAALPELEVIDEKPGLTKKLLKAIADRCIRYSPIVAIDFPDGIILDITGCAHLWGGEQAYLAEIETRFQTLGYHTHGAIADTIGAAWAVSRFEKQKRIIESGDQLPALLNLPPAALRLEQDVLERMQKLGLHSIESFISMPRTVLRRRFGEGLILRINRALGREDEALSPIRVIEPYEERLPCLEAIRTDTGIKIAIERLLGILCQRLVKEGKGLRTGILSCYRVDGKVEQVLIGTTRASTDTTHLFKLFELKIPEIEPALGIELFLLQATKVEDVSPLQEALWTGSDLNNTGIAELLDRIAGRVGADKIKRYLPQEHYWPERSIKPAISLDEQPTTAWNIGRPRPMLLLPKPEPVEVSAPVPDYPPMLFRYKGKVHQITKADGPERIESEWWLETGEHRDYYQVEDEKGGRYWLFRLGHYSGDQSKQWFIHGFFA